MDSIHHLLEYVLLLMVIIMIELSAIISHYLKSGTTYLCF
jgi:hypothetical protein